MGSRSSRASVLSGQSKQADVGSNTDIVQDGGSHWCQVMLIGLPPDTAVSYSPGISLVLERTLPTSHFISIPCKRHGSVRRLDIQNKKL